LTNDRITAERGRTDYIIVGHTHEPLVRQIAYQTVINPGELCGWLRGRATFGILDIASGKYEEIEL
jgi:putative phosphoesterase